MKCDKCGNEMELYKTESHLHFVEKRWRCMVCGNEGVDPIARKIPEPVKRGKIDKK